MTTPLVAHATVRIQAPREVAREGLLRPGMSVVVSVNTKTGELADNRKLVQRRSASAR